MSSKNKHTTLDRLQVKAFIARHYGVQKKFCKAVHINYESFKIWIVGVDTMPAIDAKVRKAMKRHKWSVSITEEPKIQELFHQAYENALKGDYCPVIFENGLEMSLKKVV